MNTSGEGEIRKRLVMEDLVDCVVMLPTQLFYNTGIPACLWFLSRYKNRDRKGEVLFIDASELGYMLTRSSRAFTGDEIDRVAGTYHEWKRYVGIPDEVEDDVSFEDRMAELTMRLGEQMREAQGLDEEIKRQLAKVGFSIDDV
jgi:type I restriction enzyme M protein